MKNFYVVSLKLVLATLLFFALVTIESNAQTPQYFKGGGTGSNLFPFSSAAGLKSQNLYLTGDLTPAPITGNITRLYWRSVNAGASASFTNFYLKLGQTTATAYPSSGTEFFTGLTTVFFEPTITVNAAAVADGWMFIDLQTPYLYDPSQTLIVEVVWETKTAGGFSVRTSTGPAAPNNKRLTAGTTTATTGNTSTIWTDFGIDIVPASACTSPPTPGTATASPTPVCTGTSVNLNLTGHSQGSGQTYVWESSSALGGPYVPISASSSFSNLTVNPTVTTYYRAAVTCSGNTQTSVPVLVVVNPALPGGTYTINPSLPAGGGNYQTIAAAVNALSCGIAGPVIFNVAPGSGPYNEQVIIPPVGGASAVNTVTFYGNNATIQATPVTATRHIIRLDGADYVRLRKFNLLAQAGSTFGWGIHLTNGADNNTIDSCTIDISAVTSTTQSNSAGIVSSGSTTSVITAGNASNNTISNNIITGAYQGIILIGTATSLNALNNTITNNEVKDFLVTGIEITHNNGSVISYNNIHRTNRTDIGTTVSQGIELGAGNINCLVNGNRVHDSHTSAVTQSGTFYGIILNADDAPAGSENRVINNLIYKLNSLTGTQYGLYNTSSDGVYYYHNTVVLDNASSTSGVTRGFYQTTLASNIQFRNNIVYVGRGGTGIKYCLYFGTTTSTILSNNNVLYNNAPAGTNGIGSFGTTGFVTLGDWQTANTSAYDQQSISVDPGFTNPATGDYTPTTLQVNDMGVPLGVTTDINAAPRSATTPDPGAYEFDVAAGVNMGAEVLITPAVAANGCYTSSETVTIRIRNSSTSTINFAVSPVTVTTNITGAVTQTLTALINTGTLASDGTLDVPMSAPLDMNTSGVYTFNAFTTVAGDVNPANDAMDPVNRTKGILSAGTISSAPGAYCITPGAPTLSTISATGYGSLQWQQSITPGSGFTDIPGATTSPYTLGSPITQTMYYRLVAGCNGNTVLSNEITVSLLNPMVTGTTPAARCGPGTVILSATGTGNTTFNWYSAASGGAIIGTGASFTTPVINNTTTYYVAASVGGGSANVGLPAELAGTSGAGTTNFGLVFDVLTEFTLQNVTIYPISATPGVSSTVTIDVINSSGAIMHTATVNVIGNPVASATAQTVTLNFTISPGTNYKLRPGSRGPGITGLLFEPSATAPPGGNYGYPFVVPGVVSINHSTLTAAPTNTPRLDLYYYFYNWTISAGCESPRTPVVATVDPAPTATMSYAGSPYCANSGTASISFSGTTGGTYTSSAGLVINSTTGAVNLATSTPGTYTVTYSVAASGACPQTQFTTPITITTPPAATISYTGNPYCGLSGTAIVTRTGTAGGTYTSTSGLVINASTGEVTLSASIPGTYTITYTIAAGGGCASLSTTATITIAIADSWTGVVNSDWNNAGNWCGGIPTSTRNVVIPAGVPNMPLLSGGAGNVRNIAILSGASLTIGAGGTLNLYGDIYATGTFTANAGNLAFRGSGLQKIPAFTAINVTQDGAGGVLLMGNAQVTGVLTLTNGIITLNGFNISLASSSSGSVQSHIVADATSVVNVMALAAGNNRTVPIGINPVSYTPVTLSANQGHATDNFSVTVAPGVYLNGVAGTLYADNVVNRTWRINEGTAGGSNVNLGFEWAKSDELIGFDRVRSQVIRHDGTNWISGPITGASGVGPYTQTLTNVTSFSPFAIRSEALPYVISGILYPNPANSELNVGLNLPFATQITISIYDSKGSLMMQQEANVNASLSRTTLNIGRLISGVYLVRVSSADNVEIFAERFVKLK